MKKHLLCLMLSVLVCTVSFPILAQSDHTADELEMIDYMQTALENFAVQTSFNMTGTQTITQTLSANVDGSKITVDQTFDQGITGSVQYVTADSVAAEIEINQYITSTIPNQPLTEITQLMGIIIVDDLFYMRVSEVSPPEMAALYPQGWVNISENPNAIPGANLINTDQYVNMLNSPAAYSLTPDTVEAIKELPEEEIDGETLRVFHITLDLQALFATGDLDLVFSAFDMSQLGVETNDLLEKMRDKAQVEMTAWVTSDNMIYRIDSTMIFASIVENLVPGVDVAAIDQAVISSFLYSDFGADFDITAPAGEA